MIGEVVASGAALRLGVSLAEGKRLLPGGICG
jgi:hypothetical protein